MFILNNLKSSKHKINKDMNKRHLFNLYNSKLHKIYFIHLKSRHFQLKLKLKKSLKQKSNKNHYKRYFLSIRITFHSLNQF